MGNKIYTAEAGEWLDEADPRLAAIREARRTPGALAGGVLQRGATSRKMHDRVFESHQLPRWDPDAPAHNPKNGKPRFKSQKEIDEYCAKKRHKEGLDLRYGEL